MVVPTFPRIIEIRAKKEFDETKLNLSIYHNSKMKRVALTENEVEWDNCMTITMAMDSNCIKQDGEYYSKERMKTEIEYVAYHR